MKRTSNYVMTIDPLSTVDMEKLKVLRDTIKLLNKSRKQKNYVKCQARGPRVAPALAEGHRRAYYFQSLALRHAVTMDVYIYDRH